MRNILPILIIVIPSSAQHKSGSMLQILKFLLQNGRSILKIRGVRQILALLTLEQNTTRNYTTERWPKKSFSRHIKFVISRASASQGTVEFTSHCMCNISLVAIIVKCCAHAATMTAAVSDQNIGSRKYSIDTQ